MRGGPKAFLDAVTGAVSYLRSLSTPGNQPDDGEESPASTYRRLASQLSRTWARCSGSETLAELRPEIQVYEEIRVWMAKYDAVDRQASGEPVPEEIQRLLGDLIASATSTGEVVDIYEAAGMPKPSLNDLTPEFIAKTQQARNPQLAVEGLRKLIADESTTSTRNNVIRQRAFSERIAELMKMYTNQQLTSAEVIAELVELAREVAAEANRGACFTPSRENGAPTHFPLAVTCLAPCQQVRRSTTVDTRPPASHADQHTDSTTANYPLADGLTVATGETHGCQPQSA
ncbi:DUF3387 domain-containing protein [Arthrobacter sp. H5]|uniref:DUF3387 domain-containing protein n=1 Tax=Arthrobacter sp. H5 TaxID=1267973 RepID=UPI00047F7574|nr:DUF3387 domain-containing protein [Arthrobacter sp. H5]